MRKELRRRTVLFTPISYYIKDTYKHVKLGENHRLSVTRMGIKRTVQQTFSIITECARFNETQTRILQEIRDPADVNTEKLT